MRLRHVGFLVALVIGVGLAGCGEDANPDGTEAELAVIELGDDGLRPAATDGKSDGLDPDAYFAQFLYVVPDGVDRYDSGQPKLTYRAGTWYEPRLELADGSKVEVKLALWMLDDGTAYAEYSEWKFSALEAETIVKTTWRVEDEALVVEGVGRGIPSTLNDRPVIGWTFDRDQISPGLTQVSTTIHRIATSSYIGHVERDWAAQQ